MTTEAKAIVAGGCFWNLQDRIRDKRGVLSTRVGYTGGDLPNATYEHHEGHAESVELVYDADDIDYHAVLDYFFHVHDPTTKDRQGKDVGRSYRSAIFYLDDEQQRIAKETIAGIDESSRFAQKVVTEVTPARQFWVAEPEHQDYLRK